MGADFEASSRGSGALTTATEWAEGGWADLGATPRDRTESQSRT
jgi:hypothetical protein